MKKTMLILSLSIFMIGTIITGCKSSADKVKEAQDDVIAAEKALTEARNDSVLQFKKESEAKITHYDRSIAELKKGLASQKADVRADYEARILEMEKKNNELKTKLQNYQAEGEDDWKSFKQEFLRDMNELGKAFEDLGVNNVK